MIFQTQLSSSVMFVLDTPLLLSTHRSSSFISFRKENGRLINILHPVGFYSTVFEKKSANLICIEFWIAYLLDNYLPLSSRLGPGTCIWFVLIRNEWRQLFVYIHMMTQSQHMVYLLLYNLQILRANPISETTLQSSSGRVEIPKNVLTKQHATFGKQGLF